MNLANLIGRGREQQTDLVQDPELKQRKLSEALSRCKLDTGEKVQYKLPLSLLENAINVKYKTNAKSGPKAYMKTKLRYGGSAYIRLFMDWCSNILPKPPAKFFTVKVTPYYAVLSGCTERNEKTESAISEMPEYKNDYEKIAWFAMCHDVECDFLAFAHRLEEPNLKVPFTIFAEHFTTDLSDPGVIIFEDFNKTLGLPITSDLTTKHLKEVTSALADIHAACFLNKDFSSDWNFPCSRRLNLTQFMQAFSIFKNADRVLFGQLLDRIHEIIEDILRTHYDKADKEKHPCGMQSYVLVHGFLSSTNLRWEKPRNPEDSAEELAYIINWQNVRLGTVTEDLLYLLCSSASPETRREVVDEIVPHYITRFAKKCGRTIFTADQILELIKQEFRFQALRALLPLAECLEESSDTGESKSACSRSATQMSILLRAKCLIDDLSSCA